MTAISTTTPTMAKEGIKEEYISFKSTNAFSALALDYISGHEKLKPFYVHEPTLEGINDAISARESFYTDRALLVSVLKEQYTGFELTHRQQENLESLLLPNTYTITTAHQPNIFTGPLYFFYKIVHAIKLADVLNEQLPGKTFVPVYYMGSEDADLDELGHIFLEGEKVEWDTDQVGAVGRMNTKGLDKIIQRIQGQYGHLPFAASVIEMSRKAYFEHKNVQQATLYLVNELFKEFGLIILIPDNARLKNSFTPIVQQELAGGFSQPAVATTIETLGKHYKVQAAGRPINLFYLDENGRRERIEKEGDQWVVKTLGLSFSKSVIMQLANDRPELFSGNVILRGLFQETVLPNVVFIGGGGEIAYWMELKALFEKAGVPYPVLMLRNSFLVAPPKYSELQQKLHLDNESLFLSEDDLLLQLAKKAGIGMPSTSYAQTELSLIYEGLQILAGKIDETLKAHVAALHTRSLKGIQSLEKKLIRAEKKKLEAERRQIHSLKNGLFPGGNLQERTENGLPFIALYGTDFLNTLYEASPSLHPQFCIIHYT